MIDTFHVLVADLGGSSLRVALVDGDACMTNVAPLSNPMGSELESDPEVWWRAFSCAVDAICQKAPNAFDSIEAIAITGATRTMVCLDQKGQVLGPASTFRDARAADCVPELIQRLPEGHPENSYFNAFHPAARLCRMRLEQAIDLHQLAFVIDPKDYLNYKLTGQVTSDPISSWRLAAAQRVGPNGSNLLDALDLPSTLLPPLFKPTDIVGFIQTNLNGALGKLAKKPVLAMSHDTWASVLGLGALRVGRAYNLSGTTEVFGVLSRSNVGADGLLSVEWNDGLHQLGGPSLCGGDNIAWALDLVGRSDAPIETALDQLLAAAQGPKGLLFLPHLQGERVPFWNPDLRGAVLGLSRSHNAGDLMRATLEGVAFLNRLVLSRAEAALGLEVDEIRFGGGGARSSHWAQIKADILGRPICALQAAEPGLIGCALAAFVALGVAPDLDAVQNRFDILAKRYEPRPDRYRDYDRLYAQFVEAEAALLAISQALARI